MTYPKHEDLRGTFEELLKIKDCFDEEDYDVGDFITKQVSICTINPGQVRGKHWHKETTEIYILLEGDLEYRFKPANTNADLLKSNKADRGTFFVGSYIYHEVYSKNGAKFLILSDKDFDPQNPDTYY